MQQIINDSLPKTNEMCAEESVKDIFCFFKLILYRMGSCLAKPRKTQFFQNNLNQINNAAGSSVDLFGYELITYEYTESQEKQIILLHQYLIFLNEWNYKFYQQIYSREGF